MNLELKLQQPFSWQLSRKMLQASFPLNGTLLIHQTSFDYHIMLGSKVFSVQVHFEGERGWLVVPDDCSTREQRLLQQQVERFLSLRKDLTPFYQLGAADPIFSGLLQQLRGYHQVCFQTPFMAGLWAILSQRQRQTIARNQLNQLIQVANHSQQPLSELAVPTAECFLKLSVQQIISVIHNRRKSLLLLDWAQLYHQDIFQSADELTPLAAGQIANEMLRVNGLGQWTVEFVLMRGYDYAGLIPQSELTNQKVIARYYPNIAPARMLHYYDSNQGYWLLYLRVAQLLTQKASQAFSD